LVTGHATTMQTQRTLLMAIAVLLAFLMYLVAVAPSPRW
jgi:hypothetical protein